MFFLSVEAIVAITKVLWTSIPQQMGKTIFSINTPSLVFIEGVQVLTACPFTNNGVVYTKINLRGQVNATLICAWADRATHI